jgi:hypothetical protein
MEAKTQPQTAADFAQLCIHTIRTLSTDAVQAARLRASASKGAGAPERFSVFGACRLCG